MMFSAPADAVYYYRYVEVQYAPPMDEFGSAYGEGRLEVKLRQYVLLRTTPKGAWIFGPRGDKFILAAATKRFALPTIEEAKLSFIARKTRQLRILNKQVEKAKQALRLIKGEGEFDYVCLQDRHAPPASTAPG